MKPKKPPAMVLRTPNVYRPQPLPRVLQQKRAGGQLSNGAQAPPQRTVVLQQRKTLNAPPVYRPQPVPKVLQKKAAPVANRPAKNSTAVQRKIVKPFAPNSRGSNSVIQRTEGIYVSEKAKRNYEVKRKPQGGKHYLLMTQEGSPTVLANMRYKFYADGTAVMEHVEAYGMPAGTRAGYLLFYIFAEHAMKEGVKLVGIGTGVDKRSVTRNLEQAKADQNKEHFEEAQRNMAAVHIYKELGFDPSDAVSLSKSTLTVQQVRTSSMQKITGFWRLRPNYRAMIQGFQQMIAQITAPLPADHQVFNLSHHIGDGDL